MMAPAHAIMGATSAVVLSPVLHLSIYQTILAMIISAGAALFPDCDQPSSTIGKVFGPFGKYFTKMMGYISSSIYIATKTRYDNPKKSGHRKLTHTVIFNLLLGYLSYLVFIYPITQIIIVGLLSALGIRGLLAKGFNVYIPIDFNGRKRNKRLMAIQQTTALFIGVIAAVAVSQSLFDPLQLSVIIVVGLLVHLLGDCCTPMGVPLLWPVPIIRKTWYMFRLPWTFEAGNKMEENVITPFMFFLFVVSVIYILF